MIFCQDEIRYRFEIAHLETFRKFNSDLVTAEGNNFDVVVVVFTDSCIVTLTVPR